MLTFHFADLGGVPQTTGAYERVLKMGPWDLDTRHTYSILKAELSENKAAVIDI